MAQPHASSVTTVLTNGVVSLRALTRADIPTALSGIQDSVGAAMTEHWADLSGDAHAKLVSKLLGGSNQQVPGSLRQSFAVLDTSGQMLGIRWLDLYLETPGRPAETGGWLLAEYRGKGYASHALRLIMRHAQQDWGQLAMRTGTQQENLAAQHNLAACGWAYSTDIEEFIYRDERIKKFKIQIWTIDLSEHLAGLMLG